MANFWVEVAAPVGMKMEEVKTRVVDFFAQQTDITIVDIASNRGGKKSEDVAPMNDKYLALLEDQAKRERGLVDSLLEKLPSVVASATREVVARVAPDSDAIRGMVRSASVEFVPQIVQGTLQQMMANAGGNRPAAVPPQRVPTSQPAISRAVEKPVVEDSPLMGEPVNDNVIPIAQPTAAPARPRPVMRVPPSTQG